MIAESHGGAVTAGSTETGGARVTLTLRPDPTASAG
jgi:hypothetical protein